MAKYELFSLRPDERVYAEAFMAEHPEFDLRVHDEALSDESLSAIEDGCQAVIVSQIKPLSDAVLDRLVEAGVKVLATRSAGYDMYPLQKLKERGIRLTNVPSYSPESIAEFAFMGALAFIRKLPLILQKTEAHDFRWQESIRAQRFCERTVGIVGCGTIGRELAKLFHQLGCEVFAYDAFYQDENLVKEGVLTYTSLDELIQKADVISLHIPATPENHHLINRERIAQMKKGTILINTARGAVLDTDAVIEALDSGHLAGALLDVYEFEAPYVTVDWTGRALEDARLQKLIDHPQVIYTPHIAYYTGEAVKALFETSVRAAEQIVTTGSAKEEIKL